MSSDVNRVELERLDAVPPLHRRVHQQLEALIVSRTIPLGARIVEGDLAAQLGVSRGPIREALQLLARDGFVDLRPRQGAFVHVPTEKEISDFFEIRSALEATSVRLAAQNITSEQARALGDMIEAASDMLEHEQDPSASRGGVDFHAEITKIADNVLLAQMLTTLKRRSDWYSPPFDPSSRREAWIQHTQLVERIIARDVEGAVDLMERHITRARIRFYASVSGGAPAPAAAAN